MRGRRWIGLFAAVAVIIAVVRWRTSVPVQPETALDSRSTHPTGERKGKLARDIAPPDFAPPAGASHGSAGESPPGPAEGEMPPSIGSVDLEEVRKAIPDNTYWKYSSPTKDEKVIEEREAERERWNVEYGKVLSGNASDDEIRAYYDQRAKLFGDYVEFASYLLDHYKEHLSEQDETLLNLALRLNRARLEEIPRKVTEAFERKRQQDAAREAWRADQAEFGEGNPEPQ